MKATSLDLRLRILETFDEGKWTQEAATKRFRFLHGLFKKLIMQRKRTGQSKVKALLRKNEVRNQSGAPQGHCCSSRRRRPWVGLHTAEIVLFEML